MNKATKKKLEAIDKLPVTDAERERFKRFVQGDERALRKRDKVLGLKFSSEAIARWKAEAEAMGKSFSDWVEEGLERWLQTGHAQRAADRRAAERASSS